MDELIPVTREALDKTALRNLSEWVIYRLCRDGSMPHVKIGRRRYLTPGGIAMFLARGGEGAQP
jgi:hypothetical protein